MENYTIPTNVKPSAMEEEEGVLRFWESPGRDHSELLSPFLTPRTDTTYHTWGSAQNMRGAGEGHGGRERLACRPELVAGRSGEGTSPVLSPSTDIPVAFTPTWIPFSRPECTGCCVLRDIIHASDRSNMKLSIHGGLGFINHALLVIHHIADEIVEEKYVADLSSLEATSVKRFLAFYGYCRYREGQRLVQDTHRAFYDALSVEMDCRDEYLSLGTMSHPSHDDGDIPGKVAAMPHELCYQDLMSEAGHLPQAPNVDTATLADLGCPEVLPPVNSAAPREVSSCQSDHLHSEWGLHGPWIVEDLDQLTTAATGRPSVHIGKTGIAAQRERTGLLKFEDIAKYFHLPITQAARELQICTTALKKVCRKYHLYRWPHRKVLSSRKRIESLEASLVSQTGEVAARTQFLLYVEQKELRSLYDYRV